MQKQKNKSKQSNSDTAKFKRQYFDFYDDIKDYTNGREDWWAKEKVYDRFEPKAKRSYGKQS